MPESLRLNDRLATAVRTVEAAAASLPASAESPLKLMEVCGTHTMAIHRHGIPALLPPAVRLISGPGCPVCVTPAGVIDTLIQLAEIPGVVVATFGDMIKVPGSTRSLEAARAAGAQVRVVYSPLDALDLAETSADRQVVFAGVGFETTAPTMAATLLAAEERGIGNFFTVSAFKTIPGPMRALLEDEAVRLNGFLCPGHVSVVTGARVYDFIPREFGIPCVVAGFEPLDILTAIGMLLTQIRDGRAEVEIQYRGAVTWDGNRSAQALLDQVFEPTDTPWRGLGELPSSGLRLRGPYRRFDALNHFGIGMAPTVENDGCRCGEVLRGALEPAACPLFATACTPGSPVGPCMVSSEGTCAAHFKYGSPSLAR